jgi:hypothetical protein
MLDDVIAELALGLLDGEERAAALAHIEQCPDCQAEVAALTASGEQLLLLAPEVPPPAGFETRVLSRIGPEADGGGQLGPPPPRRARWGAPGRHHRARRARMGWRRPLLVAAAVLVVAGGLAALLGGWIGDGGDGGDGGVEVVAADMVNPRGDVVGTATLRLSSPPVMELDFSGWLDAVEEHGGRLDARWWLSVESAGGATEMYPVALSRSSNSRVTLDQASADVEAVALLDDRGETWCTGRFTA